MLNAKALCTISLVVPLLSVLSIAQHSPCPTSLSTTQNITIPRTKDMICLVPQVYGPAGLVGTNFGGPLDATSGHDVHFQASAANNFGPINSEIGIQLSQLPLAAPASGFVFSFNPSLGVVTRSTESFGPVLTDRAETLGKHKLFVGFSYQYFEFDKADGVNLRNFGVVLKHEPEPGNPTYTNDVVGTENSIDLKVHQLTFVGTYGLADRLDLSIAIPILDVRMGLTSFATIYNFEAPPVNHMFSNSSGLGPQYENRVNSFNAIFFNKGSSFGIGDLTIRGKFLVLKGEKSGLALGLDVHTPTGEANNFLGSGTWGVRPFVTYTHSGRISPHASFGYQRNGDSVLAGNITTQPATSAHLPDIISYSAGADAGIFRRLSVSADFIGQSLRDASRIANSTLTDFGGNSHGSITISTSTVNEESVAVGAKINPVGKLLITANVLFRVNDAGLHSKPAPLIGVSYRF